MAKTSPSEGKIQHDILDFLARAGFTFWRHNNTPVPIRVSRRIVGVRRFDKRNVGLPDVMILLPECLLGLEFKSATGKQTKEQREWQERIRKAGHRYEVVRSLDEAILLLKPFLK